MRVHSTSIEYRFIHNIRVDGVPVSEVEEFDTDEGWVRYIESDGNGYARVVRRNGKNDLNRVTVYGKVTYEVIR